MKINPSDARAIAVEPGLTGTDYKIWLTLFDAQWTASEVGELLGMQRTNAAAACRKLLAAGWLDVVDVVGQCKRYTARSTRNPNAQLQGQVEM